MPSIPTLIGSAEAAKLLNIGPTNFSHLRRKMEQAGDDSFPEPVTKLQCGPIWRESDMVKFKRHYDSRRRRTPATNGDAPATPAKATKQVAKPAPAKPRSKATNGKASSAKATVTDINKQPAKRLRVKAPA
jgi:hypothetical protein